MDDYVSLAAAPLGNSEDEGMDIDEEPFFSMEYPPQIIYLASNLQDFLADYLIPPRILLNSRFLNQQVGDIAASSYITVIEDVLDDLDIKDLPTIFGISSLSLMGEVAGQAKTPLQHDTAIAVMVRGGFDSSPKTSGTINQIIRIASLNSHLRNFAQNPVLKQASKRTPATGSNLAPLNQPARYLTSTAISQNPSSINFSQATPQLSVSSHAKYPSYLRYSLNPITPPQNLSYRDAATTTPANPHALAPWLPGRPLRHDTIKPHPAVIPSTYIRYDAGALPAPPSPSPELPSNQYTDIPPSIGRNIPIKVPLTQEEVKSNIKTAQATAAARRGMTLITYLAFKKHGPVSLDPSKGR